MLDAEIGAAAFVSLINKINEQLGSYQTDMTSAVSASTAALPIVGKTAKDLLGAADSPAGVMNVNAVVNLMRNKLSQLSFSIQGQGATTFAGAAVQDLIFGAIGTFIGDNDADADMTVSASDVKLVDFHPENGTVIVDINVRADASFSQDFHFGLGLPGFPLEVSSGGELNFGITLGIDHIKFGINNSTPFVDVTSSHTVGLELHTGVSNGEFNALFGFLQVKNQPGHTADLGLTGRLSFDLGTGGISNPMFNVVAHANIPFETVPKSILTDDLQMPQVRGELVLDWTIISGANQSIDAFGQAPHVQLNNVSFQVGGLMQYIVGPLVKYMRYAMAPQQIFIGAVTQPLPGFSDIWQQAFHKDLTILEIANVLSAAGVIPPPYNFIVDAVNIMKDITNSVAALTSDDLFSADIFNTYMPLGSIDFSKVATQVNSLHDLRADQPAWQPGGMAMWLNDPLHINSPLTALKPYAQAAGRTIEEALADNVPQDVQQLPGYQSAMTTFHNRLASMNSGISLTFPLLQDPIGSVFKLFAGQNFQLVDFSIRMDSKQFGGDNTLGLSVADFPVPTPVKFSGDMLMDFYLHMGYDTVGLRKALNGDPFGMFDGFNFDLHDPQDSSQTRPLLKFNGQLNASLVAGIELGPFAGAGAELTGFVKADNVKVDIVDEDHDGYFRPFTDFNPSGALFGLQGKVTAGVQAGFFVSTILTGKDYLIGPITFGEIPIFDLSPSHQTIDNHNVYPELLKEARLKVKIKPRISIDDAIVMEGKDGTKMAKFTVTMNIPTEDEVHVHYSTQLSATAGADDFGAVSGDLVFAPNELKKTIEVPIIGDTRMEENETFAVRLSNATNAVIIDDYGTGTIIDEDTEALFTTPTGPIDVGFANNGYIRFQAPLSTPASAPGNLAGKLIYDSNGRLIVIQDAIALNAGMDESFMAVRYLPNGQLDTYFGGDGVAALTVSGTRVYGRKGAVYQSGANRDKVLIVGNQLGSMMAARFDIDGTPDPSFGNQGYIFFGPGDEAMSVAIYESGLNAGKVLVGGSSGGTITVTRLAADGSLDPTFGSNGRVQYQTPAGTYTFAAGAVSVKPATDSAPEKIVVFTGAALPGVLDGVVTQLNEDGSLDTTFGTNGSTVLAFYNQPVVFTPNDMVVQSDGKILVVASQNRYGCRVARLNADGTLDTTFANNGYFVFNGFRTSSHGVALAPDGKIVIVGEQDGDFLTIRLNSNGSLDSTFDPVGNDGMVNTNFGQSVATTDYARSVVTDSAGNILVGGGVEFSNAPVEFGVVKYEGARDDLSVTIMSNTTQTLDNGQIVYTIHVSNTGDDATFASIKDILPAHTSLVSLSAPDGWVVAPTAANGEIIAARRNLKQSDGEQLITLVVSVNWTETTTSQFLNTVQVGSSTYDINTSNNTAVGLGVVIQDLLVDVGTSHVDLVTPGTLVTYLLTVKNDGSTSARYTLNAILPQHSTLISIDGSSASPATTVSLSSLPSLAAGATRTTTIVVQATSDVGVAGEYLELTGEVVGNVADETPINNLDTNVTRLTMPFDPYAGLVSFYRAEFDPNDQTGTHNGTAVGGLSYDTGKFGAGFKFNGTNSAVALGNWFTLQSFTIGMWVRPAATQATNADIIDNNHPSNWVFQQNGDSTNSYAWGVYDPNPGTTTITLAPNTWQYMLITRDNDVDTVYLNGVVKSTATGGGSINYSNPIFRLGAGSFSGRNWNGLMDEVSIFNRALTPAEIAQISTVEMSAANMGPTIGPDNAQVPIGSGVAQNAGTFADPDGFITGVLLSASFGTVAADANNPGHWTWNYNNPGQPNPTNVTITANDGHGGIATTTFTLNSTTLPALPGDYNHNNSVGAEDYVIWRKQQNSTVLYYSGADGSGDGHVGPEDYDVWRAHFGETLGGGAETPGSANGASAAAIPATVGSFSSESAAPIAAGVTLQVVSIPEAPSHPASEFVIGAAPQASIRARNKHGMANPRYATSSNLATNLLLQRRAVERVKRPSFDSDTDGSRDDQSDDIATIDEAMSDFGLALLN